MGLPALLGKILGEGGSKILNSVGGILDNVITNKEELEAAKRETQKAVNQHIQEMARLSNDQFAKEVEDRASARSRESEFLKATGHVDYLMWFLAVSALVIFAGMVYAVIEDHVPRENENLVYHIFGIVEGVMLSIFSYYFGSSAGSRLKDTKR